MSPSLPRPDPPPREAMTDSPPPEAKVLIVDDDPITVDLVRSQLTASGYRDFLICTDPAWAMKLLHAEQPDVVLLDIVMPAISGLDILHQIRSNDDSAHLPVIILTASGDRETKTRALELGVTDFLSKPVDFVELVPRVRNALLIKTHQDRLRKYAEELEGRVQQQTAKLQETYAALQEANENLRASCAAAEAATRAKSEFLANMTHEIRTPLTAIIGFSEELLLAGDSHDVQADRDQMLQTIWCNGRHLLRIVNDILDVSSLEQGHLVIERIPCSPVHIVANVLRLLQLRADAKGLALAVRFDGPIPARIRTDPTRLQQILTNLLGNAIKFTETGSVRLVLRLLEKEEAEPLLQFEVVDTGIGIGPEEIDRLFEPFAQADASMARRFGGTGLGLTICKHLIKELGGTIEVQSTPGKGSTFRATVATGPVDRDDMVDQLPALVERRGDGTPGKNRLACRVLVAEDAPDNQRLISRILGKAGAEVVVVENGQVAYDRAMEAWTAGRPFDVILTDIQMPVLNGYRFTQRMRQAGYGGRIIALTANVLADEREKCICAGCDDYLGKPFSREELIDKIARHSWWAALDTDARPFANGVSEKPR